MEGEIMNGKDKEKVEKSIWQIIVDASGNIIGSLTSKKINKNALAKKYFDLAGLSENRFSS